MGREPYPGPPPFRQFSLHLRRAREANWYPGTVLLNAGLSYVGFTKLFWRASHRY